DLELLDGEDLLEDRRDLLGRCQEDHERRDPDDDAERRQDEVLRAAKRVLRDHADQVSGGHHAGPPPAAKSASSVVSTSMPSRIAITRLATLDTRRSCVTMRSVTPSLALSSRKKSMTSLPVS